MSENLNNFEKYDNNEMREPEDGSTLLKNDSDELNQDQKQKDDNSRFDFYFHEKPTINNPNILSEEDREIHKKYLIDYREGKKKELMKNSEMEKEIDKIKERIINLGEKLGLNFEDRLINNEDIHFLSYKIFREEFKEYDGHGMQGLNEIFLIKNKEINKKRIIHHLQHELLHSVSKQRLFVSRNNIHVITHGYLSKDNRNFEFFNEGLTELTNQQLYLENESCAPNTRYTEEVIFTTELVKDISKKTDKPYEDILAQFQIGMFEGTRGQLKIINDIYGKEAMEALSKMKNDKDDIISIAKIFGLSEVVQKLNDYENKIKIDIGIGDKSYNIQQLS